MSNKTIKPYGAWESPITSDLIISKSIGLGEIQLSGNSIFWIEMRPEEKGRYVVVEYDQETGIKQRLPDSMNARTRVHEYGGGSYLASRGSVYFSHFKDQQLYVVNSTDDLRQLSDDSSSRFADYVIDENRQRLVCVMETHHTDYEEAKNTIAVLELDKEKQVPQVLVEGADFYSNPRMSPDGKQLAWISWNHPNMPWDDSELWLADINEQGELFNQRKISGGDNESVFQPEWSPNGELYFVSDKNGWWNLYRYLNNQVEPVVEMEAEFGVPQWSFRESTYDFVDNNTIITTYSKDGISYLAKIDLQTNELEKIALSYTDIEGIQADPNQVIFLAASSTKFPEIVRLDLQSHKIDVLRQSSECEFKPGYISAGKAIEFPTENNKTAHAFFYPPTNEQFVSPNDELPPLLVFSHGGPTGMSRNGLKMVVQYFTSRGIAVLDVNYGGSSGYGREYRQRLHGLWGIVDVDDCVNAAKFLVEENLVDPERLAIRGGSAGGFTTLAALTFRDTFKAGCSRYGVSDLEALAKETHKFESRYLDNLIGPYPEMKSVYQERSPIHSAEKLSCPVIFFQGLEDKIVLPNQAEMMVEALINNGLPVAYVAFKDEQHGFRQAENIKKALDGELYFFSKVFQFVPADNIIEVEIKNL